MYGRMKMHGCIALRAVNAVNKMNNDNRYTNWMNE